MPPLPFELLPIFKDVGGIPSETAKPSPEEPKARIVRQGNWWYWCDWSGLCRGDDFLSPTVSRPGSMLERVDEERVGISIYLFYEVPRRKQNPHPQLALASKLNIFTELQLRTPAVNLDFGAEVRPWIFLLHRAKQNRRSGLFSKSCRLGNLINSQKGARWG